MQPGSAQLVGAATGTRVHLYAYAGDFERTGVQKGGTVAQPVYSGTTDLGSETEYHVAGATVVHKTDTGPTTSIRRSRRVTMALRDLLGTASAVIDLESGHLSELATFAPNGARETHWASHEASLSGERNVFTGKEEDEEVGVTYFGHRYLISRISRWASPDPLSIVNAGGGEAGNAYHFVGGNLLQSNDPDGLSAAEGVAPDGLSCPSQQADDTAIRVEANPQDTFLTVVVPSATGGETRIQVSPYDVSHLREGHMINVDSTVYDSRAEALQRVDQMSAEMSIPYVVNVAWYRTPDGTILPTTINSETAPRLYVALQDLRRQMRESNARTVSVIMLSFAVGSMGTDAAGLTPGRVLEPDSAIPRSAAGGSRHLLPDFDGLPRDQVFSGAFDPDSGTVAMNPSITRERLTPELRARGFVRRQQGHTEVGERLMARVPGANPESIQGFTAFRQPDGSFRLEFYSGGLNNRFPGSVLPEALQPALRRAVEAATGARVR